MQKAAIKKMDMQASKEFLAELNVLTHVHHVNLVIRTSLSTWIDYFVGYEAELNLFLSQS